ncbi:shikimate kinase [Pseudochelatococcus lubricantis]|uniref:Shikimate kinase n=1 Tax=Pseudochelatococcus lubricantis TaxID=1538102 RepID=A0ABX0UZX2_9HYPH|nr:shikimate kinase [Pseudochelatococcus lubricantis]
MTAEESREGLSDPETEDAADAGSSRDDPGREPASSEQAARPMAPEEAQVARQIRDRLGKRTITLIGMMGAGKSTIGRRLAQRLDLPFVDADTEIETAAGMSIPDIFATHGEAHFREGEKRVIDRLLQEGPQVLATGGGAYLNPQTRARIAESGPAIWLKADAETLMRRVRKRPTRPLLQTDDPEATLRRLMDERYPIYALAEFTVVSREVAHEVIVDELVALLDASL